MTRRPLRVPFALFLIWVASTDASAANLKPKTLLAWENYVLATEKRIGAELAGASPFLILDRKPQENRERIRKTLKGGEVYVERLETKDARGKEIKVEDGMIHHWYGSIFVPNVSLTTLRQWLQNYDRHADYFQEVEKSKLVFRDGDNFKIFLRLVRKKVVTVRYNTEHSVVYRDHASTRVSSRSIATRIAEIADAGTTAEKEKTSADDSGFLWRLNSYWRFEETDGGVIVECESISLSRSIPFGFGWIVGPFVDSVPKESLNDMLISIRDGVARRSIETRQTAKS
jgi:hypothetical protein